MERLKRGDLIDRRYRVVRELGTGGFAAVYLAEHAEVGHQVAVKVLHSGRSDERFVREAKILVRLRSPYTVRMLDFGRTEDDRPFLVCDYVEGEPLDQLVRRKGALGPARVHHLLTQILESLAEAHAVGIVHRDLKPANIFVTSEGDVRVLDFGIAKLLPSAVGRNPALTSPGFVVGTPSYMAPEQLAGARVEPSTDIFALGLVAWELLFGSRANDSKDARRATARQFGRRYSFAGAPVDEAARRLLESMVAQAVHRRPRDGAAALELMQTQWRPDGEDVVRVAAARPPAEPTVSSSTVVETPQGATPGHFTSWPEGFCWTVGRTILWLQDGAPAPMQHDLVGGFSPTCVAATSAGSGFVGSTDGRVGWVDQGSAFDPVSVGDRVTAVAVGQGYLAGTASGELVRFVDREPQPLAGVGGPVHALATSELADHIAIAVDGAVLLRDARSGALRAERKFDDEVLDLVFSPDGYLLAILTADHLIVTSAVTLDSMVHFVNNRGQIVTMRFTSTGQLQTAVLDGNQLLVAPVD